MIQLQQQALPRHLAETFANLAPNNASSLARAIAHFTEQRPEPNLAAPVSRRALYEAALALHLKAGTSTPKVQAELARLDAESPITRIAHQPNLFPYLGVFGQFFLLNRTSHFLRREHGLISSQIYLAVDYDIADDRRFRVAHLPNAQSRNGAVSLSPDISRQARGRPMWAIPLPARAVVEGWILQMRELLDQDVQSLLHANVRPKRPGWFRDNLALVEGIIWEAFERADSLTEFNMFVMSKIINVYWDLPTVFLSGRWLQREMRDGYVYVLRMWPKIRELACEGIDYLRNHGIPMAVSTTIEDPYLLPFWIVCTANTHNGICQWRVGLRTLPGRRLLAQGECEYCGARYAFDLNSFEQPDLNALDNYTLSPRVLMDDLLDTIALGVVGGASYTSSVSHMLLVEYIASRLGWTTPPTCFLSLLGRYYGLTDYRAAQGSGSAGANESTRARAHSALRLVSSGKASILYYLISQGPQGFREMWEQYFQTDRSVFEVNDGQRFSPLQAPAQIIATLNDLYQTL